MKLCIDCKYYRRDEGVDIPGENLRDICTHERAIQPTSNYFVNGAITYYNCGPMRVGICGHEAKLFEPKDECAESKRFMPWSAFHWVKP